jgi:beta-galactosidase GanA
VSTARPGRHRRLLAAVTALCTLTALATPATGAAAGAPPPAPQADRVAAHRAAAHTVTYDRHSMLIDGQRVLIQSGELHYWRLPSPSLWRDILEKYRAAGMNTVSIYFDWAYHSPSRGVYDFTGVRDVDLLLRMAEEIGLYVIARPGPYINAETTGGGFPAWLKNVPGRARSSAPGYTAAYREWLGHINPILARHQLTTGGGSIIAYNAENEYQANTDAAYMQDIQDQARAGGITVPIVTNVCCDAASWASTWVSGPGAVQLPGVDDYPQSFDCANPRTTWGPWGEGVTERLRDDIPVFAAEYQAGAPDTGNAGVEGCRELTGPEYMSYFYKSNLIRSGATMFSYYMTFGGTSWGWLPQPNDGYTSYDYGAAITEARQLTTKYDEFKRQGYFLQAVTPLRRTEASAAPAPDNPAVQTVARANPDTGTQFVLVRHTERAAATAERATLDWATPDGRYQVPVQLAGRIAQVLVAGYDLGGQRLVWSTSEIMTHAAIGGRDVAVLHGAEGTAGSTVLRYPAAPSVRVLSGAVRSSYDAATGDLRLDYTHTGLSRVLVSGGGRPPMLLLLGSAASAAQFWRADTPAGPVLVRGTSLVRSAQVGRGRVDLRADSAAAGEVEVFAPGAVQRLAVNGTATAARRSASGSLVGRVAGPASVRLPALTNWRSHAENPEAAPGFDDSRWTVADKLTTESPIKPKTLPVLYADDYGYHYGNVWYRGRFTATGAETAVSLNAITGRRGIYLVWLNGRFLGSANGGVQADSEPVNPDPGPGTFTVPAGLLRPGAPATLSVLVENMGHNDDWTADDVRFKQPRGLVGAALTGAAPPITWRIQGARGGERLVDPVRGPLNTGGLYGERAGWHLPGYPALFWRPSAPSAPVRPGVTWQRTTFDLRLPARQDTSVALRLAGNGDARYRVLIFLNGWNVGQFGAGVGPQHDFVLPAGLLRHQGRNSLALAVIAQDAVPGGIGPVQLVSAGTQRGGVPVTDVRSPGYGAHR